MKNSPYYEIDVARLLRAMLHRMWAILLAGFIFAGAGFAAAAYLITPKYEAEALMYVNNSSSLQGGSSYPISSSELTAAQSLVDTYIAILKTRTTLNDVIKTKQLDLTYEEILEMISSDAVNNTEVFSIRITSDDPQEAAVIANGIAEILPDKISEIVDGSSVRIVDYAVTPSEKSSPSIIKYTAIGFVIGAIIACAVIVIRTLLDTLIHDEDYLLHAYDLPVLAVIPDHFKNNDSQNYYKYSRSTDREPR